MARPGKPTVEAAKQASELHLEPGRRHIIKRPRLTRLLDESKSRIIMLVAPAGYGKTTLAREWVEDKPHAWYQATGASSDVAALAAGIADALSAVVDGAAEEIHDRLRAGPAPEDVERLVRALARSVTSPSNEAWLVIDDYQLLRGSSEAERFVELIATTLPVSVLLTTRERPSWTSARHILYGEVDEIGRSSLAMDHEEASEVLAYSADGWAAGLVALAEGWPAVIGLAAAAGGADVRVEPPPRLYEYFAEELYQGLPEAVQDNLLQLSYAPLIGAEVGEFLFGADAEPTIDAGVRVGALTRAGGDVHIHPLLQQFLKDKLARTDPEQARATSLKLTGFYRDRRLWDAAFETAKATQEAHPLVQTLEDALEDLLTTGRLRTVSAWLEAAREQRIDHPILDLAAAEVAMRQGELQKASVLARTAAEGLALHRLEGRAYLLAGLAAHGSDAFDEARTHFAYARAIAQQDTDSWQALWGLFLCTAADEDVVASEYLKELQAVASTDVDLALRRALAPSIYGARMGSIVGTLEPMERAMHILDKSRDPMVRSAFLNGFAHRLLLAARYTEAREIVERQIADAEDAAISLAVIVGIWTKAAIELGLHEFDVAEALLDKADRVGSQLLEGARSGMSSAALRARLYLAQGRHDEALHVVSRSWSVPPERSVLAEFQATKALALAVTRCFDEARQIALEAVETSRGVEAQVLAAGAQAIVAHASGSPHEPEVTSVFEVTAETGCYDGLIATYRAYPPLLEALTARPDRRRSMIDVLVRGNDWALAKKAGLRIRRVPSSRGGVLSKREREVYALIQRGMTNREIAKTLFISESTAKVHVLHILEKLGCRSRAEAAALRLLDTD